MTKEKMKENPARKITFQIRKLESKKNPDGAEAFAPVQNQYKKINELREQLKIIPRIKR